MDVQAIRVQLPRFVVAVLTAVVAVVVGRTVAALLGVDVVVPEGGTGELVPLRFGPLVLVTVLVTVAAVALVIALDRFAPHRGRSFARAIAFLLLLVSLVPVVLADPPRDVLLTLVGLHLAVYVVVARGILRS